MTLSTVTEFPVSSTTVRYNRGSRLIYAFQSKPRDWGHYPGVMVLHDVEGLTDAYREVTRKLAALDYVSKAPDLYSRAEVPKPKKHLETAEQRLEWFKKLEDRRIVDDLARSWEVFSRLHWVWHKPLAIMGFGLGAYYAILHAAMNPQVRSCVAVNPRFLLDQPELSRKEKKAGAVDLKPHKFHNCLHGMKAELITVFPGQDETMPPDQREEFLNLCDRQSVTHTTIPYEGAGPGFWLEGTESYQADYAEDMWGAVLKYFSRRLG